MANPLDMQGVKIGGHEIVARLGAGGMGSVYKARDAALDRFVAIKVLAPALEEDPVCVQRFHREARSIAALRHPNLMHIYAVGEEQGLHYFVMEYIEGMPLSRYMVEQKSIALAGALRIAGQVMSALHKVHCADIIHRDLKPENVLVVGRPDDVESLHVKVVDWGIARAVEAPRRLTATGMVLGTPAYMAPEQIRNEALGPATDMYALGCGLYRLLAGRGPVPSEPLAATIKGHLTGEPTPLRKAAPECPIELAELCHRLLAKDSSVRAGPAAVVAERLEAAVRVLASTARAPLTAARAGADEDATRTRPSPSVQQRGRSRRTSTMDGAKSSPQQGRPLMTTILVGLAVVSAMVTGAMVVVGGGSGGARTTFAVQGLRLLDLDVVAVVCSGIPPHGTFLRVRTSDETGSSTGAATTVEASGGGSVGGFFDVPLPVERNDPAVVRVALGRDLLEPARLELRDGKGLVPRTATERVAATDLEPLKTVARLDDNRVLRQLLDGLRDAARDPTELLAGERLTGGACSWLAERMNRLVPTGCTSTAPGVRLILPLVLMDSVRRQGQPWVPPWGPMLPRMGYVVSVLEKGFDEQYRRPLPRGRLVGRATVHTMLKGPRDVELRHRMTWVHAPEQYEAAHREPEKHVRISDQLGFASGAASASIDDWQPRREVTLSLDEGAWPLRAPVLVLDLRYHTHDRALLVTFGDGPSIPVVRPGTIESQGGVAIYLEHAHRWVIPIDPALLRPKRNRVVLTSRLLTADVPLNGTRVEGLAVVDVAGGGGGGGGSGGGDGGDGLVEGH